MFDQNYIMREKIFCPFLPFLDLFYTKNDKKIKIYVVKTPIQNFEKNFVKKKSEKNY